MKTIKSSRLISLVFNNGKKYSNKFVIFIVLPNNFTIQDNLSKHDRYGRVAYIAGKKNGNAVWRNKAKRRLRSISHELIEYFPDGKILLIAKRSILNSEYLKVRDTCCNTLKVINNDMEI